MTEHSRTDDLPARVAELRNRLSGVAFLPGEPGYDEECRTYNLTTPLHPRVAVGAASVADVRAAVGFAARNGLGVAVRGGGHAVVRQEEDILVINLRRMRAVSVDAPNRRVRFEGGALWHEVRAAVAPHGLTLLEGSTVTIGAAGYLLGGGHSPHRGRLFGWAAEYVTRIEVVTADGRVRQVDADTDPELFFALRGTKGNFGVVTAVEVEALPPAALYGGGLWFAGEHMADVLECWRVWTEEIPVEMSTSLAVHRLPPDPALPESLRGAFVLHVRMVHSGSPEDGEKVIERMRTAAPVVFDTVRSLAYEDLAAIHRDPPLPLPYADRSSGLAELPPAAVDALVRVAGPESGCRLVSIEIRHLGGALDRAPRTPDAIPVRGLPFQLFAFGVGPDEEMPALRESLAGLVEAMRPWAHPRRMMSFLSPDEATDAEAVRELYGPDLYDRLARIKRRHDPANMFRINHNIEPAGSGDGR